MRPDGLYNFWQDETNIRGLLRRTSLASDLSERSAHLE
jgi:prolyl oligopeptidase PreP (S9A serine peptidase family)